MPSVELVREVDAYRQTMTVDIIDWTWDGAPRGWKVRVCAYDGKSPMPSRYDLLPGGKDEAGTVPLYEATVAKCRADGWADKLAPAAVARIEARRAREDAEERAREEDLARRSKAFPATALDRVLAAALAKPEGVRELDLRARGDDRLTVIPKTVKKLASLEVLRLDGNGLPEIPQEIEKCKELRELYAANNAIVEMPAVHSLKRLAVLDLRNNRMTRFCLKPKTPMRLEIGGNPLEPAVQDLLTRSAIGDFRTLTHVSVDTDCLFPIDLSYFEVDYPGVKTLSTSSIVLYGRAPTEAERATLAKLLPKATIEHRSVITFEEPVAASIPTVGATKAAAGATDSAPSGGKKSGTKAAARKPAPLHKDQAAHLTKLLALARKLKIPAKTVEAHARPCIELHSKAPSRSASKVGASRLGGAPDMPADAAWPVGSAGPMMFVAQLDCAEFAPFDPARLLPESGLLAFFAGGYDEGVVMHFEAPAKGEKLAPRAQPKKAMFSAAKADILPACAIRLRGAMSLPGYEQVNGVDADLWHELHEASMREKDGEAPSRVLAHTAGDVEAPPEGDLALLALVSDDHAGMCWGDAGTLYFMLEEAALRARAFGDVEVVATD